MARLSICYAYFYDYPRTLFTHFEGRGLLLDADFDEAMDDYTGLYQVAVVSGFTEEDVRNRKVDLSAVRRVRDVGAVALPDLRFDATRRASIDSDALERLLQEGRTAAALPGAAE